MLLKQFHDYIGKKKEEHEEEAPLRRKLRGGLEEDSDRDYIIKEVNEVVEQWIEITDDLPRQY